MIAAQSQDLEELVSLVRKHVVLPNSNMLNKRQTFVAHVKKFHADADISSAIEDNGIILMTAHQPNLFPYSGVVRKATLLHAVAETLQKDDNIPIMELFCFADQDFADERWFKSAQLPSVTNKGGILELRVNVNKEFKDKLMFAVPKPLESELERLKAEINRWANNSKNAIKNYCQLLGLQAPDIELDLASLFEIVDVSYKKSSNMADFNAYFLANVIKDMGYDTSFVRFSECQHIFFEEISLMLENFELYSKTMKDTREGDRKVYAPIWYHCTCNGKADVEVKKMPEQKLVAKCRSCGKINEFEGDAQVALEMMLPNISLRAEPMPIAFGGIGVSLYVGGIGGIEYLTRAKKIADKLHLPFPVVAIWRPKETYPGAGQLNALLELARINYEYNLIAPDQSCSADEIFYRLQNILSNVDRALEALNTIKDDITNIRSDNYKERIAFIVNIQNELQMQCDRNKIARDLSIVQNVPKTLELIPSIIDYAANLGLKSTSYQWLNALESNINFESYSTLNINDRTDAIFDKLRESYFKGDPCG